VHNSENKPILQTTFSGSGMQSIPGVCVRLRNKEKNFWTLKMDAQSLRQLGEKWFIGYEKFSVPQWSVRPRVRAVYFYTHMYNEEQ